MGAEKEEREDKMWKREAADWEIGEEGFPVRVKRLEKIPLPDTFVIGLDGKEIK
jgi:hypothetical protein